LHQPARRSEVDGGTASQSGRTALYISSCAALLSAVGKR
jgi:hypothetical protein